MSAQLRNSLSEIFCFAKAGNDTVNIKELKELT